MALLKPKNIIGFSRYKETSFDLLFKYLVKSHVELDHTYTDLNLLITVEKFFWRAADSVFAATSSDNRILGSIVTHAGIHHLLATRYRHDLRGMPQFTLLGESLASCSDMYFFLVYFGKHGYNHPFVKIFFNLFKGGAKAAGLSDRTRDAILTEGLENPFLFYKNCVEEFFNLCGILFDLNFHRKLDATLKRRIKTMKHLSFFLNFDFPGFVLYAQAHCGPKSSPLDQKYVKACLGHLKASQCMDDFLVRLGVDTLSENSPFAKAA